MKNVDLYGNGVMVPVCDECLKGSHNTMLGKSHIDENEPERSDCKEVGMLDGKEVQCCCGVGGFVFKGDKS